MALIITIIGILSVGITAIIWIIYSAKENLIQWHKVKKDYDKLEYKVIQLAGEKLAQEAENEKLKNEHIIQLQEIEHTQELINAKKEQYNQMEITEQAIRDKLVQEREIWFKNYKKNQEEELKKAAFEFVEGFNAQAAVKINIGAEIAAEIDQLRKTAAAAIEIAKHKEEEQNLLDYYRLTLSPGALADMAKLREIMPELNQPEVLGKLIWKVYLEKPYSDLCGRLFGDATRVTGIYKITNLNNEMCYVGQAVNVIDRWKQHIKRAIGAETPIQNKLYPAMSKEGIENFTFELIEEVSDRLKLDEREDYWQNFYKAKEYGYSIK